MERNRDLRRRVLTLLGGTALAAALPARSVYAQGAKAPLTLGIQTSVWGAVGMVAEAEKMFEKAGANVKVLKFDSGKTTRDAMIAGKVDIGSLGTAPFIVGVAKGELGSLATVAYAGRTNSIVAAKGAGIKTVADLKGKKVGSQIGSSTHHIFANRIAPKFGLKPDDFQIINTKFENHNSALAGKSVDAYAGVEPYPSVAEVEGLGVPILDYGAFDIVPVWLAVNKPVLETKRDAVIAFMRGWLETVKLMKQDPDRAARAVWNFYKSTGYTVKQEAMKKMLAKLDLNPDYVPQIKDYLMTESKLLLDKKQIAAIPDWDKALDRSIMQKAGVKV